jgi:hypothetical protein
VWGWSCGSGDGVEERDLNEGSHVRDESRGVYCVDGGAKSETVLMARRLLGVRRVSHS